MGDNGSIVESQRSSVADKNGVAWLPAIVKLEHHKAGPLKIGLELPYWRGLLCVFRFDAPLRWFIIVELTDTSDVKRCEA